MLGHNTFSTNTFSPKANGEYEVSFDRKVVVATCRSFRFAHMLEKSMLAMEYVWNRARSLYDKGETSEDALLLMEVFPEVPEVRLLFKRDFLINGEAVQMPVISFENFLDHYLGLYKPNEG